jgi:hypothetical protein
MLANAGEVGMLEGIARTVDARSLAVPNPQDTIVLGAGEKSDHLTAEDRCRGQILIDSRGKVNVVLLEQIRQTFKGQIKPPKR